MEVKIQYMHFIPCSVAESPVQIVLFTQGEGYSLRPLTYLLTRPASSGILDLRLPFSMLAQHRVVSVTGTK